ncbi:MULTISPECIES: hypothetical protein [unclassified Mycobacterium]|uniref:hypothetical protein n=1 Tax=unclassified Mycobacterium TaxID=2642494 RepID=UPI002740E537|nr:MULTISPECIES: hypothetical protein [unclassified Mycobacterium]MDP7705383.1 hypothetical protein [Mycobacterium sp. TY815]MDP7724829.1 hypothetical protein [Mycobacterium sp. TY814]
MSICRILLAAISATILGPAAALATPLVASASALADGMYRFDFDGSKQTIDGVPKPTGAYSTVIAMRSACPPAGCVATAWDTSIGPTWPQPPEEGALVFRENRGQWLATRWKMFTCNNSMKQGTETLSFQVKPDGTFVGVSTQSEAPCAPIIIPFVATRVGDISPDVQVADPNSA